MSNRHNSVETPVSEVLVTPLRLVEVHYFLQQNNIAEAHASARHFLQWQHTLNIESRTRKSNQKINTSLSNFEYPSFIMDEMRFWFALTHPVTETSFRLLHEITLSSSNHASKQNIGLEDVSLGNISNAPEAVCAALAVLATTSRDGLTSMNAKNLFKEALRATSTPGLTLVARYFVLSKKISKAKACVPRLVHATSPSRAGYCDSHTGITWDLSSMIHSVIASIYYSLAVDNFLTMSHIPSPTYTPPRYSMAKSTQDEAEKSIDMESVAKYAWYVPSSLANSLGSGPQSPEGKSSSKTRATSKSNTKNPSQNGELDWQKTINIKSNSFGTQSVLHGGIGGKTFQHACQLSWNSIQTALKHIAQSLEFVQFESSRDALALYLRASIFSFQREWVGSLKDVKRLQLMYPSLCITADLKMRLLIASGTGQWVKADEIVKSSLTAHSNLLSRMVKHQDQGGSSEETQEERDSRLVLAPPLRDAVFHSIYYALSRRNRADIEPPNAIVDGDYTSILSTLASTSTLILDAYNLSESRGLKKRAPNVSPQQIPWISALTAPSSIRLSASMFVNFLCATHMGVSPPREALKQLGLSLASLKSDIPTAASIGFVQLLLGQTDKSEKVFAKALLYVHSQAQHLKHEQQQLHNSSRGGDPDSLASFTMSKYQQHPTADTSEGMNDIRLGAILSSLASPLPDASLFTHKGNSASQAQAQAQAQAVRDEQHELHNKILRSIQFETNQINNTNIPLSNGNETVPPPSRSYWIPLCRAMLHLRVFLVESMVKGVEPTASQSNALRWPLPIWSSLLSGCGEDSDDDEDDDDEDDEDDDEENDSDDEHEHDNVDQDGRKLRRSGIRKKIHQRDEQGHIVVYSPHGLSSDALFELASIQSGSLLAPPTTTNGLRSLLIEAAETYFAIHSTITAGQGPSWTVPLLTSVDTLFLRFLVATLFATLSVTSRDLPPQQYVSPPPATSVNSTLLAVYAALNSVIPCLPSPLWAHAACVKIVAALDLSSRDDSFADRPGTSPGVWAVNGSTELKASAHVAALTNLGLAENSVETFSSKCVRPPLISVRYASGSTSSFPDEKTPRQSPGKEHAAGSSLQYSRTNSSTADDVYIGAYDSRDLDSSMSPRKAMGGVKGMTEGTSYSEQERRAGPSASDHRSKKLRNPSPPIEGREGREGRDGKLNSAYAQSEPGVQLSNSSQKKDEARSLSRSRPTDVDQEDEMYRGVSMNSTEIPSFHAVAPLPSHKLAPSRTELPPIRPSVFDSTPDENLIPSMNMKQLVEAINILQRNAGLSRELFRTEWDFENRMDAEKELRALVANVCHNDEDDDFQTNEPVYGDMNMEMDMDVDSKQTQKQKHRHGAHETHNPHQSLGTSGSSHKPRESMYDATNNENTEYNEIDITFTELPSSSNDAAQSSATGPDGETGNSKENNTPDEGHVEGEGEDEEVSRKWEFTREFVRSALNGMQFIKFGRMGKPHERLVTLRVHKDNKGVDFDWTSGKVSFSKNDVKVHSGKHTKVFRKSAYKSVPEEHCFSIETKSRTVDLQAANQEQRDYWVEGLKAMVAFLWE